MAISIIGVKGECGCDEWLHDLGLDTIWHAYCEEDDLSNIPDIEVGGLRIDVKSNKRAYSTNLLLVPVGNVHTHWAYVLASPGDRAGVYFLYGWEWGGQVKDAPVTSPQPERPAHTIEAADLRDMEELAVICRREARAAWMRERVA